LGARRSALHRLSPCGEFNRRRDARKVRSQSVMKAIGSVIAFDFAANGLRHADEDGLTEECSRLGSARPFQTRLLVVERVGLQHTSRAPKKRAPACPAGAQFSMQMVCFNAGRKCAGKGQSARQTEWRCHGRAGSRRSSSARRPTMYPHRCRLGKHRPRRNGCSRQ